MASKGVPATITKTAFECPHCGVYTTQFWFDTYARRRGKDSPTPKFPDEAVRQDVLHNDNLSEEQKQSFLDFIDRVQSGAVHIESKDKNPYVLDVVNLHLSLCYDCKKVAVWIHDNLAFPPERAGPPPNEDIPEDVARDYEEARSIVNLSPRGAAALLRLCIQKLCKALGEEGKHLDTDIGHLVAKGLSPMVQQALDIVRVIGNNAVHPGLIDLRDDRDTAMKLFGLVNLIAEQMITQPKHVRETYEQVVPESARKAIEARNQKAGKK